MPGKLYLRGVLLTWIVEDCIADRSRRSRRAGAGQKSWSTRDHAKVILWSLCVIVVSIRGTDHTFSCARGLVGVRNGAVGNELIAGATMRYEEDGLVGVRFEVLPQPHDEVVDAACIGRVMQLPDAFE